MEEVKKEYDNHRQTELTMLQALPFEVKVMKSRLRFREFIDFFGAENVYISFSGGKDSTVLLHLVRSEYPNIKAVFCDTGLEYPELKMHVKTFENVDIIRPKKSFVQVINEYGYPMTTKQQSLYLHQIRRSKSESLINLRVHGIRVNGEKTSFKLAKKWKYLIDAPFKISDKCCDVMKKNPAKIYEKETGKNPILGTMASESSLRKEQWMRHGCNAFDGKRVNSRPLSFWTEQDILEYIHRYELTIPSVYGELKKDSNGKWFTTGVSRTGCIFCGFGVHLEKAPNRYQQLQETHPQLYNYCMDKLGFRQVCNYMNIPIEKEQYNFFEKLDK